MQPRVEQNWDLQSYSTNELMIPTLVQLGYAWLIAKEEGLINKSLLKSATTGHLMQCLGVAAQ